MDSLKKDLRYRSMWRETGAYYKSSAPEYWLAPSKIGWTESEEGPALFWEGPTSSDSEERLYDYHWFRSNTSGMLNAFLSLPSKGAAGVEEFASRYGVLGLCRHWRPNSHIVPGPDRRSPYDGAEMCSARRVEPLAEWMAWAVKFRAAAGIAADLHRGGRGRTADWERLAFWFPGGHPELPGDREMEALWSKFSNEMDALIEIAGLEWRFSWTEAGPSMELVGSDRELGVSVLWFLARELIFMVSRTEGAVFCGNPQCPEGGLILSPKRRPTATRRAYCDSCRKGNAKSRLGQRKLRAKLKEAKA